uniref:Uncharacterized protein n=1 Tax=Anguilla anguilla TaxID=7936 RepID=A0A0E9XDC1_ANGAN
MEPVKEHWERTKIFLFLKWILPVFLADWTMSTPTAVFLITIFL